MFFLQKLLDISGLTFIFEPPVDDEAERQRSLAWINQYIAGILEHITEDIEAEKLGFYPHPENTQALNASADSLGYLRYIINDIEGQRLELTQLSLVSCNSIKMTDNYRALKFLINNTTYNLELKEITINNNGKEIYTETDDAAEDHRRYFIIYISGW